MKTSCTGDNAVQTRNKENIEIFWRIFKNAYKKANNEVDEKFHPRGWCTDMASCNFIGWCTDMVSCNLIA